METGADEGAAMDSLQIDSPKSPGLINDIADSRAYRRLQSMVDSPSFDLSIGSIIVLNLVLVVVETDVHAKGEALPEWVATAKVITLPMFCLELALRICVHPIAYWHCTFNVMDFSIISMDVLMLSLASFVGDVSFLRLVRLLRLARVFLVFDLFPELRLLMAGLGGAVKSIAWGTLLLGLILIMWSILAVQLIHPLNLEVAESGLYTRIGCERCPHAFESCYQSVLTLIQQVVAGDSWGQVSLPIMESHPLAGIFFLGVLLSVGLAVMNLILAVVVNVGITERDKIQASINEKKWESETLHEEHLLDVCKTMQEQEGDGAWAGVVYLNQMIANCKDNKDFTSNLESMGVDLHDLYVLATVLDPTSKGQIQWEAFIDGLYKIKQFDSVYMLTSIKHAVSEMKQMLIQKTYVSPTDVDENSHLEHATRRPDWIASKPFGALLVSTVEAEASTRRQEWLKAVSLAEGGDTKEKSRCQDKEVPSDPETSASTCHKRPAPDSDSDFTCTDDEPYTGSSPRTSSRDQSGQSAWQCIQNSAPTCSTRLDVEEMLSQHLIAMQHMHELHVKVIESVRLATPQHGEKPLVEEQVKVGCPKDPPCEPVWDGQTMPLCIRPPPRPNSNEPCLSSNEMDVFPSNAIRAASGREALKNKRRAPWLHEL